MSATGEWGPGHSVFKVAGYVPTLWGEESAGQVQQRLQIIVLYSILWHGPVPSVGEARYRLLLGLLAIASNYGITSSVLATNSVLIQLCVQAPSVFQGSWNTWTQTLTCDWQFWTVSKVQCKLYNNCLSLLMHVWVCVTVRVLAWVWLPYRIGIFKPRQPRRSVRRRMSLVFNWRHSTLPQYPWSPSEGVEDTLGSVTFADPNPKFLPRCNHSVTNYS